MQIRVSKYSQALFVVLCADGQRVSRGTRWRCPAQEGVPLGAARTVSVEAAEDVSLPRVTTSAPWSWTPWICLAFIWSLSRKVQLYRRVVLGEKTYSC